MMTHAEYQEHLAKYAEDGDFLRASEIFEREFSIISEISLDAAIPILGKSYCPIVYSQPRDPVCMLRSLLLMTLFGEKGITAWVAKTRAFPCIAVFCGSDPADTPGIGTYYDFMDRITDGPWRGSSGDTVRRSEYENMPHRRKLGKSEPDDPAPYHSKSERLATELLAGAEEPLSEGLAKTLGDLLFAVGIIPNIEAGLITGLENMTTSGDGSIFGTAASPCGKPSCDCRENGTHKCDHPRDYSSPTAEFCFDAIHDTYVFGDRYYHIVTAQGGHDFPLITIMPGGNESDYTLSLRAADIFIKLASEHCPGMNIGIFCGDGHHDSYAHYHYFDEKGIVPVIPLRKGSREVCPSAGGSDVRVGTDGIPICPGGSPMRHHCYNKNKKTHVFSCPAKRNTHRGGKSVYVMHTEDCPLGKDCKPGSSLGPCAYMKSEDDPRFFPPIPRNSRKYKAVMRERSASERVNAVNDHYVPARAHRSASRNLIRLTLANIVTHAAIRHAEAAKRLADAA